VFKEYDVQKRYNGSGMEFGDVQDFRCESHVTKGIRCTKAHDHCSKLKLPREKDPSPTHYANRTYGGAKIEFGFV
jgi:hypothetical protein